MQSHEAIARIKQVEPAFRALGAASLYLFGSTARDETAPNSDVDVFIDRDPSTLFTFVELTEIEFLLERVLATKVDFATRTSLHPDLRPEIERTAIRVF